MSHNEPESYRELIEAQDDGEFSLLNETDPTKPEFSGYATREDARDQDGEIITPDHFSKEKQWRMGTA